MVLSLDVTTSPDAFLPGIIESLSLIKFKEILSLNFVTGLEVVSNKGHFELRLNALTTRSSSPLECLVSYEIACP